MILTILVTSLAASLLATALLRPYSRQTVEGPLSFTPAALEGFSWTGLTLSSFVSLYLELLLIRWLSSEVQILGCSRNLVLIASSLGFGRGCYLWKRATHLAAMLAPLVAITALVTLPFLPIRN